MGRDSAVPVSGGSWFHHWDETTEKSLDWADRELPSHWGDRSEKSLDWTERKLVPPLG
jgi:hypothetical protein